ncbi:MAG: hypothetical protein ACRC0J_23015, partial [Shewanella oncorhynchi]
MPVICNGISVNWLYDTGADVSVISENLFKIIRAKGKVVQINEICNLTSASKNRLQTLGRYFLKLNIMGKTVFNPVYVCKDLNQNAIMGIDLMKNLNLTYNVKKETFQIDQISRKENETFMLKTKSSETIPALTARPLRLQGVSNNGHRPPLFVTAIATVKNEEFPCLFAKAGLVKPNRNGEITIWVKNCHPFEIQLQRDEGVGSLEIIDADQLNQMEKLDP